MAGFFAELANAVWAVNIFLFTETLRLMGFDLGD
jgi:hypothetical protein